MKLTIKSIMKEFQRTYDEIERITREKANQEDLAQKAFKQRRAETQARIDRVRKIMRSKQP